MGTGVRARLLQEALTSQLTQEVKGRNVGPIESSSDFSKNGFGEEMVSESLMHKMLMGVCFILQSLASVGSCDISFSQLTAIQAQVGGAM